MVIAKLGKCHGSCTSKAEFLKPRISGHGLLDGGVVVS